MIILGDKLAEVVASKLETEYMEIKRRVFPDREVCPRIPSPDRVTGNVAVLIWRISRPFDPNSYLIEVLLTLRNLKSYGASEIHAVLPYFPYSRQDKVIISGEPLSSVFVSELVKNLSDSVISVETHSKIDGVKSLSVREKLASYLKDKGIDIIVGPDKGSSSLVKSIAKELNKDYVCLEKTRNPSTGSISISYSGDDINGKHVALIDDILSSGGTIKMASDILRSHGASRITACVVHPVLVGNWREIGVDEIVATNTIPSEISVIDVSDVIAEEIKKL